MKKISKKIVSLVTMAAFVLTLVPAAAFGATGDAKVEPSAPSATAVGLNSDGEATVTFTVKTDVNWDSTYSGGQLAIWAGTESTAVDGVTFEGTGSTTLKTYNTDIWKNVSWVASPSNDTTYNVTATFTKPGTYDLRVGSFAGGDEGLAANVTSEAIGTVKVGNAADYQTSHYVTVDENVTVDPQEEFQTVFEVNDGTGLYPTVAPLANVTVWAVEEGHELTDATTAFVVKGVTRNGTDNGFDITGNVVNDQKLTVSFTREGTYTLYAGIGPSVDTAAKNLFAEAEGQIVTVNPPAAEKVASINVTQDGTTKNVANKGTETLADVLANNTATKTVTVTPLDANDQVIPYKELQVTSSDPRNLVVTAEDDSFVTDRNGNLELTYKATKAGSYRIYVKNADDSFSATLKVEIADDSPITGIEATVNNGQTIELSDNPNLSDAVQIELTDANGDVVSNTDARLNDEPIVKGDVGGQKVADYVEIIDQPNGAGLTEQMVKLVPDTDTGAFTIAINGATGLKEGEYTVQLALLNGGANVQVTFTLAPFGEVQDMIIDVNDEVVLDSTVTATVKYVDENGIERAYETGDSAIIGYSGAAVASATGTPDAFVVTAKDNENYLGSVIKLTAIDDYYGLSATADVTVVDGITEGTLAFDPTSGEVAKNNTVTVSVVDEDGNVIDVNNATITAYVADAGNANVSVEPVNNGKVTDGKGKIRVYSDAETTADFVVAVKVDTGVANEYEIYAATLSYTFGEADVTADTIVGMTIGSSDYIVNNDVVSGDAAPYIDENWRTMAPVRVINETFGAIVDFKDNVITIVKGDTTVVMTVGETAYTVNGDEYTMDTAPVIRDNDRAYVPARFMAEALGYTVTTLKDANGLTAGVVFQK